MYFTTTSSSNKLIAISGSSVPRFVQGIGNLPRFQIVPQPRISPQTTLRPIAPRMATSTSTVVRPQVTQIQLKPVSTPRPGKQVLYHCVLLWLSCYCMCLACVLHVSCMCHLCVQFLQCAVV
jgi:hypothetical protein